jgi:hypothetical protein
MEDTESSLEQTLLRRYDPNQLANPRTGMPQYPAPQPVQQQPISSTGSPTPSPGSGSMYPQVIVTQPDGSWKSSPDPSAPWHPPTNSGGSSDSGTPTQQSGTEFKWDTGQTSNLDTGYSGNFDYTSHAPLGYANDSWRNPEHQTPKYVAGRILFSGGTIEDAARASGGTAISADKIRYPDGTVHDFFYDVGGPQHRFQHSMAENPNAPSGGSNTGTRTLSSGVSGSSGSSSSGSGVLDSGMRSGLESILMGRASQSLTDIGRNDPIIAAQSNAFSAQQQRAMRDYLMETAERQGPNANMNMERRMAAENVGQATGAFEAQLMGRELEARRREIMQSLELGLGYMSEQDRIALQRELGLLEAELGRMNLGQRAYEFDTDDEFRRSPLAS